MRILIGALAAAAVPMLSGCGDADIARAHAAVESRLNDSGSAKFRNDQVLYVPPGKEKIVCGEVNAKNFYGGYAGFTPYVVEQLDSFPHAKFSSENALDIKLTCSFGKAK
jgi:hypothetical protein